VKLLCFYIVGGALVATLTSGLDPLHPAGWWDNPIAYQKAVLWTILLECRPGRELIHRERVAFQPPAQMPQRAQRPDRHRRRVAAPEQPGAGPVHERPERPERPGLPA
jgi:hypothetical protein